MFHGVLYSKYKIHHLLCWAILFAGWYFLRRDDFPNQVLALQVTAVKIIILALLVYLTNYFLIPRFLYTKQYALFTLVFLLVIAAFGFFKIYLLIQLLQPYYRQRLFVFDDMKLRIYDDIIPLFLLVSTGAAANLVMRYIKTEKRLADISREKAENELRFLRSQINPHFVFNTLNAIYFEIDKSNQEARNTLLQFSDLLRYQLYECNADTIAVEKEMAYLKDYVALQQKRKDDNYTIEWNCSSTVKGFQIVPLLLMPFVENAFKHISHYSDKSNIVDIKISKSGYTFNFSIVNTCEEGVVSKELQYGGIGLQNVKRRLELLYPEKHVLRIENAEGVYAVNLSLHIP